MLLENGSDQLDAVSLFHAAFEAGKMVSIEIEKLVHQLKASHCVCYTSG